MNPKQRIERLYELISTVLAGLEGNRFAWGNGQRLAWVPLLREAGITLVTKTQIEKRDLVLKRNAKPVGSAYFGAPIKRYADLYVLEVQTTKPKAVDTDCWLFLNCEMMTGSPPEKCPNRKACKQNAMHSSNRVCKLPYEIEKWHPILDEELKSWLVVRYDMPEEAKSAGWHPAENFTKYYVYKNRCLWVGREDWDGWYCPNLPQELTVLGWATSVELPYWFINVWQDDRGSYRNYLEVITGIAVHQENGWYKALKNLYYKMSKCGNLFSCDELHVSFPTDDPNYSEAIALGWYPAVDLMVARN